MGTLEAPYCEAGDLLTGDLRVGANVDKQSYIDSAGREIDSRLGYLYTLPLEDAGGDDSLVILDHAKHMLRKINTFLASGRLLMALASGSENVAVHAYGESLVRDALAELDMIVSGSLELQHAKRVSDSTQARNPVIQNQDRFSAVDSFENAFIRDDFGTAVWAPGPYD